jgi:hypothetical protein
MYQNDIIVITKVTTARRAGNRGSRDQVLR